MPLKRLSLFYTVGEGRGDTRLRVDVDNGVDSSMSGYPLDVIKNMRPEDLGTLVAFCRAVCSTVDNPKAPSMFVLPDGRKG